jgi:hypothetical protein
VDIYADLWRLAGAMLAHVSVWFIGVLEVLVALRLMGFPVSYVRRWRSRVLARRCVPLRS